MLTYEECKNIAIEKAKSYNVSITKVYNIGNDFVFDTDVKFEGVFPVVVSSENGNTKGLWIYINEKDLSMYDMEERPLKIVPRGLDLR